MKYEYDCPKCAEAVSVYCTKSCWVFAQVGRPCDRGVRGLKHSTCPLTILLRAVTELGDPALIRDTLGHLTAKPAADEVGSLRVEVERLRDEVVTIRAAAKAISHGYRDLRDALSWMEGVLHRADAARRQLTGEPVDQSMPATFRPSAPAQTSPPRPTRKSLSPSLEESPTPVRHHQPPPSPVRPATPFGSGLAEMWPQTPDEVERARQFHEMIKGFPSLWNP
ncbi:hypothetical protein AB0H23_32355 [Streptomyces albogriseolus]|uniref:hypothetical protein n=1 Tax=Streptomyces albogriseolus TaxID=1887 RepID=UPI00345FB8D8